MRRFALIGVTICLLTAVVFYLHLTGRFGFLRRTPDWNVVVNGATVDGEVLAGRAFAVVTRRDKGKEHSYLLFYEGDVDQTGDMGRVIDCRKWIAPRLPILIETSTYPNCQLQSRDNANTFRMSLIAKDGAPQFLTTDGDVISIRKR
ncbi:MAG: hypothetical protein ABSD89_14885 [Halobacteriota archaeon]|jgi:hypothetical protein